MSHTDSFIDEVTEEVRRDRLFALMRRWAWLAVLIVLVLVGGTAWREYRVITERHSARSFGDAMLAAVGQDDAARRVAGLDAITAPSTQSQAVLTMLAASETSETAPEEAAKRLLALSKTEGVDQIYRQIAVLKAVSLPGSGLSAEARRAELDPLTLGQGLVRLLAQEQLALIEVETGARDAALDRLKGILQDSMATGPLQTRAMQLIIALGGDVGDIGATATDAPEAATVTGN